MLSIADRRVLGAALGDNDDPVSGIQYQEVAQIAARATDACRDLENYLLGKIDKASPRVKVKILKVVRYIAAEGHPQFRTDIKNRSEAIRACLQYRGEPDPVHGDAFNQNVRERAQEAINAIYDTTARESMPSIAAYPEPSAPSGNFGNGSYTVGSTYSDPSSSSTSGMMSSSSGHGDSRMVGITLNEVEAKKRSPIVNAKVAAAFTEFGRKVKGAFESLHERVSGQRKGARRVTSFDNNSAPTTAPIWAHGSQDAGSGWGSAADSHISSQPSGSWGPVREHRPTYTPATTGSTATSSPAAASSQAPQSAPSNARERAAVDEITAPAGVRVAPTRVKLLEFMQQLGGLDNEFVVSLLLDKIESNEWQSGVKALCVLEEMLKKKNQAAWDILEDESGAFTVLLESDQQAVRAAAQRVLAVLKGEAASTPSPAATRAGNANSSSSSASLFGDMDLLSGSAAPPAQSAGDMFSTLTLTSAPAPATSAATSADPMAAFFGSMALPSASAARAPASASSGDLLGDLMGPPSGSPAAAASGTGAGRGSLAAQFSAAPTASMPFGVSATTTGMMATAPMMAMTPQQQQQLMFMQQQQAAQQQMLLAQQQQQQQFGMMGMQAPGSMPPMMMYGTPAAAAAAAMRPRTMSGNSYDGLSGMRPMMPATSSPSRSAAPVPKPTGTAAQQQAGFSFMNSSAKADQFDFVRDELGKMA